MKLSKLATDLSWNYLSFAILAVSGLLINFIIAFFYSASGLGIFNQTYAFFVIFSQFASFGIHYSVLKRSAEASGNKNQSVNVFMGGIFASVFISIVFCYILFLLSNPISKVLDSQLISITLKIISPALIFMSLNKALLSFVNGQDRLKLYAIGNILRYIFMVFSLIILISLNAEIQKVAYIFLIAEVLVTIYAVFITRHYLTKSCPREIYVSSIEHIKFGSKAFLSGLSVELNSRVDVLILAIFVSDSIVGVYSFFALVAEGFYNLFVVVKNIYNPKVTKLIFENKITKLRSQIKKLQKYLYPLSMLLATIILFFVYLLIPFMPDSNIYLENIYVLFILIFSIFLISGIIPFEIILTLAGRPALQSLQTLLTLILNVSLNFILVPKYFALGAAVATGLSYIFGALILYVFSLMVIKVKIL